MTTHRSALFAALCLIAWLFAAPAPALAQQPELAPKTAESKDQEPANKKSDRTATKPGPETPETKKSEAQDNQDKDQQEKDKQAANKSSSQPAAKTRVKKAVPSALIDSFLDRFTSAVSRGDESALETMLAKSMPEKLRKQILGPFLDSIRKDKISLKVDVKFTETFNDDGRIDVALMMNVTMSHGAIDQHFDEDMNFVLEQTTTGLQLHSSDCVNLIETIEGNHRLEGAFMSLLAGVCGFGTLFLFLLIVVIMYVASRKQKANMAKTQNQDAPPSA